jgi:pimeloyl-ACP methyl ester carboxylesterase
MSEPLLLIPGMMCDARMWGKVPELLGDITIHHALPIKHDTITALAMDILEQAPSRFALAGLSMGGIVAMEMLAQAPERISRIALLDTNAMAEAEPIKARRGPQIERALAGGLYSVMRHEMKPHYLADGPDRDAVLDLCMEMAIGLGPEIFQRQSIALRDRPDYQATLAQFKGPALVLMGADDRLCPLDRHTLMHSLMPQSCFAIIQGAGHLPTLERPGETAAAMINWLRHSN